jgi:hypothetical protein
MLSQLPDEILHTIGRFIIETERTSQSSSVLSATYFYFITLGQLNWSFYEQVHDSSFWEHDVFSIVLRNNKFEDDDEEDTSEEDLLLHLLELMKHCQFSNIRIVAYKHTLFVNDLIYKGILLYPEISDSLCSLELDSYNLPPLERLLPVVTRCEQLKEISLKFYHTRTTKSYLEHYDSTIETDTPITSLEKIAVSCGKYSKLEFLLSLLRASPNMKHFKCNIKTLTDSIFQALSHCTQLEILDASCTYHKVSQDIMIEFIRATKVKEFLYKSSQYGAKMEYVILEEITRCWCDSIEKFVIWMPQSVSLFSVDNDSPTLSPCPALHHVEVSLEDRYYSDSQIPKYHWLDNLLKYSCTEALRTLTILSVILPRNANLRYLCLKGVKNLKIGTSLEPDQVLVVLDQIGGSLEKFTYLRRDTYHAIDLLTVEQLVSCCPNVRVYHGNIPILNMAALADLSNLTSLHVCFTERPIHVNKPLESICHLTIKNIFYDAVYSLLDHCPNLHSLSLGNIVRSEYGKQDSLLITPQEIALRCPNLKVLDVCMYSFSLPCHTNFKSLIQFANRADYLTTWGAQKLAPIVAWMICCKDLSNFVLEQFIELNKLRDVLESLLGDLDGEDGDDKEMSWKLFVCLLNSLRSEVETYITGDDTAELIDEFFAFILEQETKYKARGRKCMPVGERGWDLTLPQLYDNILNSYPKLSRGGFGLLF